MADGEGSIIDGLESCLRYEGYCIFLGGWELDIMFYSVNCLHILRALAGRFTSTIDSVYKS